jgi:nucleoside phosphorylase
VARLSQRSQPVEPDTPPEGAYISGQQKLHWLAGQLGQRDALIAQELERTRETISLTQVDVIVLTATDLETRALEKVFQTAGFSPTTIFARVNTYSLYGPIGGATVAHVRCNMGSGGAGGAAMTVGDAIADLRPWAVIAVGIAFGIDEDKQPIGQLLLSAKLSAYELQRVGEGEDGQLQIIDRGDSVPGSPTLLGRFRDSHLEQIGIDVKPGEVLSGEKLIDNADFKAALLARYTDAIGGEMEGAGVLAASYRNTVDWLVVKSVCDYAQNKGQDKKIRQEKASAVAATAFFQVLTKGALARRP